MQVSLLACHKKEMKMKRMKEEKKIRYDRKWVQAVPVTLVTRPSIKACLGLFLISCKYEQERKMIRYAVGGVGGWWRTSKGDEKGQMGGGEGRKRGGIGGIGCLPGGPFIVCTVRVKGYCTSWLHCNAAVGTTILILNRTFSRWFENNNK